MDTLTGIKVFQQVVELGSFVEAADRLDMSTATVSKHVAHLEQRLGIRLLNRNTRGVSLTEAGQKYFERTKTILEDLQATEVEISALSNAPRGTLRITCHSFSAGQRLADLLAEYHLRFPEVVVHVAFEDREVDLVEEGYDIALRTTEDTSLLPPDLIARPIRPTRPVLAGAPSYLERRGVPKSPEDLSDHDFVGVANVDSIWLNGPAGRIEITMRVVLRFRSYIGVANAVAAGLGLAPLPAFYFDDPTFKDKLVPVLTEYPMREGTLYLAYVSRKYVPLKIRSFIDFFTEKIAARTADPFPNS